MWRSEPIERTTTAPEFNPTGDLDEHALGPSHGLGVLLDRVLHPERRVAGPHRVILMGERRPEQRHDPVSHDLVHRPLVAVDGLHHVLKDRIQELAGLFGVAVGEQLHRAFEVGEEDGDLLALTFQGGARVEDARGEVLRSVRLGCRGRPGIGAGRMRAFRTELRSGREPGSASSARRL